MYSKEDLLQIYNLPIPNLVFKAAEIHRQFHDPLEIKINALLSVKTGGCTENCSYCPQSVHYDTNVKDEDMLDIPLVLHAAQQAKEQGASRFCLGTAWREVEDGQDFENILTMVQEIKKIDLEVCCTLGMVSEEQALRLKEAGLDAYNHNLDTGDQFYKQVISTRSYQQRLNTLENLNLSKIAVCSGGIIGMGEKVEDRIDLIYNLLQLKEMPESVPINLLVPIEGTPLEDQKAISFWHLLRTIALVRIAIPSTVVRLSAGRKSLTEEQQGLCFLSGANSIFSGAKLLTTENIERSEDEKLLKNLGMYSTAEKSSAIMRSV